MSDLEKLVPSLELCKLIPAGEFEDSYFVWAKFDKWVILLRNCVKKNKAYITEPIICPAPTLQEIIEAIGGIKEISYPDQLNPGRILSRDPQYEPSIEYFPGKNFPWRSMRWTTSIWEENEKSATAAALRTYLGIKKVEVTMPCPECGTWLQRPDDEHPEHESFDELKVEISEFCPECGFKFYDGPFLFVHKEVKKHLIWVNTQMGSRWIKKQSDLSESSAPSDK